MGAWEASAPARWRCQHGPDHPIIQHRDLGERKENPKKKKKKKFSPLLKSSSTPSPTTFCMYGVSPKVKKGGMRRCHVSGPGRVSKKGFGLLFELGIWGGFVGEMIVPRFDRAW